MTKYRTDLECVRCADVLGRGPHHVIHAVLTTDLEGRSYAQCLNCGTVRTFYKEASQ